MTGKVPPSRSTDTRLDSSYQAMDSTFNRLGLTASGQPKSQKHSPVPIHQPQVIEQQSLFLRMCQRVSGWFGR